MPLKIKVPIVREFVLSKSDAAFGTEGEATRISVRQATQAAHERRSNLFSNIIREFSNSDEGIRLVQRFSLEELKRIEVFLTLAACNIEDENGNPMFQFTSEGFLKDENKFTKAWGQLPTLIAQEIHECVLMVNVDWQPEGE